MENILQIKDILFAADSEKKDLGGTVVERRSYTPLSNQSQSANLFGKCIILSLTFWFFKLFRADSRLIYDKNLIPYINLEFALNVSFTERYFFKPEITEIVANASK